MALNDQVRVDIAAPDGPALEIKPHTISNESGYIDPLLAPLGSPFVFLRLYPPVLATLRATVGAVVQQGVRQEQVPGEAVVFRGTAEASTEHLVQSGLEVDIFGTTFDATGAPLQVSITADASGRLRASQPFWGAAIVSYVTQYRLLKYSYAVAAIPGGTRITSGTVLAFHAGQTASFDVPAPTLPAAEPDVAEVYRDVSYVIHQAERVYERPPNWPDETWPQTDLEPDDAWTEEERVHAKGKMEGFCRLAVDREYVRAAEPFENSNNYQIPIERIVASDESLVNRGFSLGCIQRVKTQIPEELG